jgi:hypothetical protein
MQKMRYTPKELGIIKSLFSENEESLIALRKKFLGVELTETEKNQTTFNEESLAVLSKTFNPQIDPNAPIHQVIDLWMTVDIKEKTPEEARINFKARKLVIEYIVKRLEGKKVFSLDSLTYSEKNDDETNLVNATARNTILGHIEQQLQQLQFLAGQKEETVEELMERLEKNSAK